jgi:hypothetical protein
VVSWVVVEAPIGAVTFVEPEFGVEVEERWLQKYKPPRIITANIIIVAITGPVEFSCCGIVIEN